MALKKAHKEPTGRRARTSRLSVQEMEELKYPADDGVPMEDIKHEVNKSLLMECTSDHLAALGRSAYVAGNNFIYYENGDPKKNVGPDFFVVLDAKWNPERDCWRMWNEDGKTPEVIVEFLSKRGKKKDYVTNFAIYRDILKVQSYFICDNRRKMRIDGFRLEDGEYKPIAPDEHGHSYCEALDLYLGFHEGWARWFTRDGKLVPNKAERLDEAKRQANEEARLRRQAEDRLAHLEEELRRLRGDPS